MSLKKDTNKNYESKIKFSVLENKTENFIFIQKKTEKKKIVISKRIEKKANKRNKIRRRIKEIIRNIKENENYQLRVRRNIVNKKFEELQSELIELIEREKKSE